MSRSTFAERFTDLVGQPPMPYLAQGLGPPGDPRRFV